MTQSKCPPLVALVLLGLLGEAACLTYLLVAPQLAVTPPALGRFFWPQSWLQAASLPADAFLWLAAAWFAVFLASLWVVARCPRDARTGLIVTGFALLQAATLFFTPAQLSTDVYFYAMAGRKQVVYHQDAYQGSYFTFPDDPLNPFIQRIDFSTLPESTRDLYEQWGMNYGPLWTVLMRGVAMVAGPDAMVDVLAVKGLMLAVLAAIFLVLRKELAPQDDDGDALRGGWFALLAFAWNPLVLIEAGADAHNDALMALLAVLGFAQARRGRPAACGALLALSLMTKSPGLFLLGGYLLWLWFHERTACPRAAIAAIAASAVFLLLFPLSAITHPLVLANRVASDIFLNSFHSVLMASLVQGLAPFWRGDMLDMIAGVKVLFRAATTVAWVATVALLVRRPRTDLPGLVGICGGAMVVMFLFMSAYFWSWYLILPLACLVHDRDNRLLPTTIALSFTTLYVHYLEWRGVQSMSDTRVWLTLMYAVPLVLLALTAVPRSPRPATGAERATR